MTAGGTGAAAGSALRVASPQLAYALLLVAPLCMASNVVIGRAAAETVPPVALAFWRWTAATVILLPVVLPSLLRHRQALIRSAPRLLLLGALGMGICGAFVYIGVQDTTATNAGLIYAASPVLILLIGAVFQGDAIGRRQVVGVVLALAGVATIVTRGDPAYLLSFQFNVGDLWILGATVSWAVYSVLVRQRGVPIPTLTLFAATALAGVVCLAPFYAIETIGGAPIRWTAETLASIAGVAVISSILAFTLYQVGIRAVGPARAGVFMYLMPGYTVLLSVALLGETFAPFHAVGFALILPGLVLAGLRR